MAKRLCKLVVLALACSLVFSTKALAQNDKSKGTKLSTTAQATPKTVIVYSNGTFGNNFRDASKGCIGCNWQDAAKKRNASKASLSATIVPWGSITIAAVETQSRSSVLDFWVKGSGLSSLAFYLKDTRSNIQTSDIRFARAEQKDTDMITVLASDNDGWLHMRINLENLNTSCGNNNFDRIIFEDVSGMGFYLQLDDMKLLYGSAASNFAASAFTFQAGDLLPVFGDDMTVLKSAPNRYVAKLKPTATMGGIVSICNELNGKLTNIGRRFRGICNTPLSSIGMPSIGSAAPAWRFMTLTVNSEEDLKAVREHLGDHIEYLEADLTVYSSTRALRAVEVAPESGSTSSKPWDPKGPIGAPSVNGGNAQPMASTSPATLSSPIITMTTVASGTPKDSTTRSITGTVDSPAKVDQLPKITLNNDMNISLGASEEQFEGAASVSSWGLDRIDQYYLPMNGKYTSGDYNGQGVHIYVLDTGARVSHQDFVGRVGDGASAVGSTVNDDNGHGSHAAATALGSIHGVARSAIFHPVKVLGADGTGSYSNFISAIQWVKDHRARNNIKSAIISMSLAGPYSASLNDAVKAATDAGITVVAAAGNNRGADACTMSPASAPTAITVGASTSEKDGLASFSNIGRCLSIFAPGQSITSAGHTSDGAEATMSGTSMATPHVAGAAALYLQYRPGALPSEVKVALMRAATPVYFEQNSEQRLLNIMSDRLRAAGPQPANPAITPAPATPQPAAPSPSPKPTSPAPTTSPSSGFSFPSLGMKPAWCSTCTYCAFC